MNTILLISLLSMLLCIKICLYIAIIYYASNNMIVPNYLLNFSYQIIYYYSKLQLKFMKIQNNVIKYVNSVPFFNNLLTYKKNIYTYTTINEDLTICNKYNEELNLDLKIILNYVPNDEKKTYIESFNHKQSEYKFIMSEITIDDKTFVVHFTTDKYNYLIEHNKLDSNFIKYFLKTHYTELVKDLDLEKINYHIKIIDHNVNVTEFDNTKTLYINKNDYILTEQLNKYLLKQYKKN
jgi:hypothetical protein